VHSVNLLNENIKRLFVYNQEMLLQKQEKREVEKANLEVNRQRIREDNVTGVGPPDKGLCLQTPVKGLHSALAM